MLSDVRPPVQSPRSHSSIGPAIPALVVLLLLAALMGAPVGTASASLGAGSPDGRVTLRSPSSGSSDEEAAILLGWTPSVLASEYIVFVSTQSLEGRGADALLADAAVAKKTTASSSVPLQEIVRGEAGSTLYWWAVAARDRESGALALSEVATFTAVKAFQGGAPAAPLIRPVGRGTAAAKPYGDAASILLASGLRFDPVRDGEPDLPAGLTAASLPADETGAFLVQIDGAITKEEREALVATGAVPFAYLPNYTFLVRMPGATKPAVEALSFVRWVGAYHPAYKLSPQPAMSEATGTKTLTLLLFPDADMSAVSAEVVRMGGAVVEATDSGRNKIVRAAIDMSRVTELAARNDVAWVEPSLELVQHNANAQWVVQTNVSNNRRVWDMGLHGEGQVVHSSDSGIRTTHNAFRDAGVPINGFGDYPTHRKIIAYRQSLPGVPFGDHPGASYHGTHTAGTLVADDSPFSGDARDGMALKAKIFFTDSGGDALSILAPGDLNLLFGPAYEGNAGGAARISSNSWGAGLQSQASGMYTVLSMTADQFLYDHKDFLISFSNGNDSAPGSVGTPATFKNGVSSGSTGNGASANQYSYFSSQGPTNDGRMKPTICSPGSSLQSPSGGSDTGYQTLSGTSMSCPSGAGAMVLIRQYLTDGWYPTGAPVPANGFTPSGALVKALAISSTDNDMLGMPIPNNQVGWGRINVDNILYFPGDTERTAVIDDADGLATGEFAEYEIQVTDASVPLKVTLCWFDKEGSPGALRELVNDLNLTVTDPANTVYVGNALVNGESVPAGVADSLNVEEGVRRNAPATGTWRIRVEGRNVPFAAQTFALAISGGVGTTSGVVQLDRHAYGRDDVIEVRVEDTNASSPITVNVSSDSETTPEALSISGANGVFVGTIATTAHSALAGDGNISVSHGDAITASYADANPAATVEATAVADFEGPVVTGVGATANADVSATVRWTTDLAATSRVYYGLTPSLGQDTSLDPTLVTTHALRVDGLLPATTYYFDVESVDHTGNSTRDNAGGGHYRFTTGSKGDILLVVGDNSFAGKETLYDDAFASRGWSYNLLGGGTISDPLVGDKTAGMRSYAAVWWQTGQEQYPPFPDAARDSLARYHAGGGRLAVSSHDVSWAFSDPASGFSTPERIAWLANILHTDFLEDPPAFAAIAGVANDPISGSYVAPVPYVPHRPQGAAGDEIALVPGTGSGEYIWSDTDATPDNIAVRWVNGANDGSPDSAVWGGTPTRVVSNHFEWPQIVDAATRADILDKTLVWLIGRDHPDVAVTSPNGGDVITTNTTSIAWTETAFGGTSIAARSILYSSDGGSSWNLITTSPGASPYVWDVSGLPNGGEYRVRIVVTDSGTPSLRSGDNSDANFSLNRVGGDTRGPVVVAGSIMASPNPIDNEAAATLSATATDVGYGGSNIAAAEWSRGGSPAAAGTGVPMGGTFTSPTVDVSANLAPLTIPTGEQTFWVRARDAAGSWGPAASLVVFVNGDERVSVESALIPQRFALEQNAPNPFNPLTTIRFALPKAGDVTLAVYNVNGQRVRTLVSGHQSAGLKSVLWDGRNDLGESVTSGVYLYRLEADEFGATRKMVLLK